jgi:hypothetical protein
MPLKRGRPVSNPTTDPAVIRRREQTAVRAREYYARRRTAATANTTVTLEQLQQGERIVSLAFTEEDAAITLTQL